MSQSPNEHKLFEILYENRALLALVLNAMMPQKEYSGVPAAIFVENTASHFIAKSICMVLAQGLSEPLPDTSFAYSTPSANSAPIQVKTPTYIGPNANSQITETRKRIIADVKSRARIILCPFCNAQQPGAISPGTYQCNACLDEFEILHNGEVVPIT